MAMKRHTTPVGGLGLVIVLALVVVVLVYFLL
jgi:hypothetical protein